LDPLSFIYPSNVAQLTHHLNLWKEK
jgi:hypothetical protein